MKLRITVYTMDEDVYLRIPVSIEDHEMDVTAYDYLQEYYPATSHGLHMIEEPWSVCIHRGLEDPCAREFDPTPEDDAAVCDYIGLCREHETPRGDVHGRSLKEHIEAFTDRLCTDLNEEDE